MYYMYVDGFLVDMDYFTPDFIKMCECDTSIRFVKVKGVEL